LNGCSRCDAVVQPGSIIRPASTPAGIGRKRHEGLNACRNPCKAVQDITSVGIPEQLSLAMD